MGRLLGGALLVRVVKERLEWEGGWGSASEETRARLLRPDRGGGSGGSSSSSDDDESVVG